MENNNLVFGKLNYILMVVAVLLLIVGSVLMTMETAQYGIGTLGTVVGPMIILAGFGVAAVSIFVKSGDKE